MEFALYCDDEWKKGTLGTFCFIVATVSTFFMGVLIDTHGRLIGNIINFSLGAIGCFILGFSPNYWFALFAYGLTGFLWSYLNFIPISFNEIGNGDYINLCYGCIGIFFSLMELLWVGIGYWL